MRSKTVIPVNLYVEWSTGRLNAIMFHSNSKYEYGGPLY
jgi:hypothetical protein